MALKVGCCGFPGGRAAALARFPVVEVQQTFYDPPTIATLARWRSVAPADFEFTLKAWQLITHPASSPTYRRLRRPLPPESAGRVGLFQDTPEVWAAWERTAAAAATLRARIVLFQAPPSFQETPENVARLRGFFAKLPRQGLLCAWEPRGAWSDGTIAALCRELRLIHCVDPLEREPLDSESVRYFRLHGGPHYRGRYDDGQLRALAERWGHAEGCVLFNNLQMAEDAARLRALLGA